MSNLEQASPGSIEIFYPPDYDAYAEIVRLRSELRADDTTNRLDAQQAADPRQSARLAQLEKEAHDRAMSANSMMEHFKP